MFTPRPGQWVKFKTPAPILGAHAVDGFTVGIFTGPQRPSPAVLETINKVQANSDAPPETAKQAELAIADLMKLLPARIALVDCDGFNLLRPPVKGVPQGNWWLLPTDVSELGPVTDREHVPVEDHEEGKEHMKRTCHPGWVPRA